MRRLDEIKRDAESYQRAYRVTSGGAECQRTRDTIALVALVERLRDALADFADRDCHYGDGCPPFAGTRHGTCDPCKARAALAAADGTDGARDTKEMP